MSSTDGGGLWIIGFMVVFVDAFVLVGASLKKLGAKETRFIINMLNNQKNWYK
jgi:hypothetical protein